MNNIFYMVYLEGGGQPTYKHDSLESAEKEAKRLCMETKKKAYILKALKSIELDIFKETTLYNPEPDIPF